MAGSKLELLVLPKGSMWKSFKHQLPVHFALIPCQCLSAIYYVVTQVALTNGFSPMVLSFYRDLLALMTLAPIAYYVDKGNRVKLSWSTIRQLALLGFTGIFGSNYLLFLGIQFTSAEFSSGLQPAAPVATAFIAIIFGVERVLWRRRDGQAKFLGVCCCCMGALLMTFWHGPAIIEFTYKLGGRSSLLAKSLQSMTFVDMSTTFTNMQGISDPRSWEITQWQMGFMCLLTNSLAMGTYLNLQSKLLKKFPCPVSVLCYAYLFGTIFMGITTFFSIKDPSQYALYWDSTTAVVLYNGVIASALNFLLMSWSLTRVGPLFVASYINMQPPITVFFSVICLRTTLYLGSLLGTILIFTGLFLATWSWAREETIQRIALDLPISASSPHSFESISKSSDSLREPLLKSNAMKSSKTNEGTLENEKESKR